MSRRLISVLMACILCLVPLSINAAESFSSNPDAIEEAAKSVLMLEVYDENNDVIATGSGFVAFNDRTLVTNYHVIQDGTRVIANSDEGYRYEVSKIFIIDEEKDIAICGFESSTGLKPLELNTDKELKRAENIVAIGSPIGITNTVSLGNISALYKKESIHKPAGSIPLRRCCRRSLFGCDALLFPYPFSGQVTMHFSPMTGRNLKTGSC